MAPAQGHRWSSVQFTQKGQPVRSIERIAAPGLTALTLPPVVCLLNEFKDDYCGRENRRLAMGRRGDLAGDVCDGSAADVCATDPSSA